MQIEIVGAEGGLIVGEAGAGEVGVRIEVFFADHVGIARSVGDAAVAILLRW